MDGWMDGFVHRQRTNGRTREGPTPRLFPRILVLHHVCLYDLCCLHDMIHVPLAAVAAAAAV